MSITFRPSRKEENVALMQWLKEKEVLRFFPMANSYEIEDAVNIWLYYIQYNAAISCEFDGKLAGMAVFYIQTFEKLRHQSLFAIINAPEYRGKGIGSQFLKYLFSYAKKTLHLEKIHLEVYEGNPAHRLYERLGFIEYGRHEDFLKDGDEYITKIVMEKDL